MVKQNRGDQAAVLAACAILFVLLLLRKRSVPAQYAASPELTDPCQRSPGILVTWDRSVRRCVPDVCRGAALEDIPDVSGVVRAGVLCSLRLTDMMAARQCLRGKRVLLLGDSTMTETVHDLVMLLAGLGNNQTALHEYARNGTRQNVGLMTMPMRGDEGQTVDALFHGSHRHMTVTAGHYNITVVHRFTGHHEIGLASEGIASFAHPDFQKELGCLLGEVGSDCASQRPDILLINSGMHDTFGNHLEPFSQYIEPLMKRLAAVRDAGTDVMWVGSHSYDTATGNFHVQTMGLDHVAASYCSIHRIPFIDVSRTMRLFLPPGSSRDLFTTDMMHWGAIAYYHSEKVRMTMSSLITQTILDHICHGDPELLLRS